MKKLLLVLFNLSIAWLGKNQVTNYLLKAIDVNIF